MSGADKATLDGVGTSVATWATTLVRHIIVDFDGGDDTRVGYIDAAPNADLSLTAPAVALKTLTAAFLLVPRYGNGRKFEIIVKGKSDGTTNSETVYIKVSGYRRWWLRGTYTDTTAGCTAFDGTTADHIHLGFIQVAGTNAAGYKVAYSLKSITAATATSPIVCTVVGHGYATGDWVAITDSTDIEINGTQKLTVIDADTFSLDGTVGTGAFTVGSVRRWKVTTAAGGVPGWTDEGSGIAVTTLNGKRLRADGATTTSSWRNKCCNILANGVDTMVPANDPATWSAVAGTDIFYIEEPRVRFSMVGVASNSMAGVFASGSPVALTTEYGQISGINAEVSVIHSDSVLISACEIPTGSTISDTRIFNVSRFAYDLSTSNNDVGTPVIAGGVRATAAVVIYRVGLTALSSLHALATVTLQGATQIQYGFGVVKGGLALNGCGYGQGTGDTSNMIGPLSGFASNASNRPLRISGASAIAGLQVSNSAVLIGTVEITDCSTLPCVGFVQGAASPTTRSSIDVRCMMGTRGNAGVGISFRPSADAALSLNNTVNLLTITTYGMRGTRGSFEFYSLNGTAATAIGAVLNRDEFRSGALGYVEDPYGNRIGCRTTQAPGGPAMNCKSATLSATGAAVSPYRVIAATTASGGADRGDLAIADTLAHAIKGVLGVNVNDVANVTGANYLIANRGLVPVKFDRSGAHPAPAVLGWAYLSISTAGLAQADVPALSVTTAKQRLGIIRRIHPTDTDTAYIELQPDSYPILSDGNP